MQYESFYAEHVTNLKAHPGSAQASGKCPWHDDKISSLSVNLITGLWSCHGGCGVGNALTFSRRLGVQAPSSEPAGTGGVVLGQRVTSSARQPRASNFEPRQVTATYTYEDELSNPVFRVLRYTPKGFSQQHWDGFKWVSGRSNAKRVPYRLPQILATTSPIYFVEGEKDVGKLEELLLVATTTPMGAGNWTQECALYFKSKRVVIIPDNDGAGKKMSRVVACDLARFGATVKIVELPGLLDKQDVSDYLDAPGNSRESLLALVRSTDTFRQFTRSIESPVDYFAKHNITVVPPESLIPGEAQQFCKDAYNNMTFMLKEVSDPVMEKLDELDGVWKKCGTKSEYARFLGKLKEVHEVAMV